VVGSDPHAPADKSGEEQSYWEMPSGTTPVGSDTLLGATGNSQPPAVFVGNTVIERIGLEGLWKFLSIRHRQV